MNDLNLYKMKQTVITVLMLLVLGANAQNHFVGIDAGVYWSNVTSRNFADKTNYKTSFSGGLTYEYFFNKSLSIETGMIYNLRGFTVKTPVTDEAGNPTGEEMTVEDNYNYLSVPIKIGYTFGNKFFGFVKLGLVPAVLLDAQTIIPAINSDGENTGQQTIDITSKVRNPDVAGLVELGGGYKFTDRFRIKLSFSYQHSFTSITNSEYYTNSTILHNGMNLALGLNWAIKTKLVTGNEE